MSIDLNFTVCNNIDFDEKAKVIDDVNEMYVIKWSRISKSSIKDKDIQD